MGGEKMSFISLEKVSRSYQMGEILVHAVEDISFQLEKGDFTLILGPSGGGKTTILNLLGGIDSCSSGTIHVGGKEITDFNSKQLTSYRRRDVGFVFQQYHLLPKLTALENVEIATKVAVAPLQERDILDRLGLKDRRNHFPSQLSGGEQQRVAIARALAKKPKLLLCDEPTAALDEETSKHILQILQEIAHLYDITVVLISHDKSFVPLADKVIYLKDGSIEKIIENDSPVLAKDLSPKV